LVSLETFIVADSELYFAGVFILVHTNVEIQADDKSYRRSQCGALDGLQQQNFRN
jgi:hypothetical protein